MDFLLISKRDCMRLGSRLYSRGADSTGNVSNFAETEQILTITEKVDNLEKYKVFSYL